MITIKIGARGEEVKLLLLKLNVAVDGIFGSITEEAVKAFLKTNGLTVDGIVGPKTWEKLLVIVNKRDITEIIIHCTATPEGKDYTVDTIRQWHKALGWSDIGYHWVIYRDGSINKGRDESIVGAHCTGHNTKSIGVCYVGGLASDGKTPKDTRTEALKVALIKLLKELKIRYPKARIYSHGNFAAKACPSFNATTEYKNI